MCHSCFIVFIQNAIKQSAVQALMHKYAADVENSEELKFRAHWSKNIQVKTSAMFLFFLHLKINIILKIWKWK